MIHSTATHAPFAKNNLLRSSLVILKEINKSTHIFLIYILFKLTTNSKMQQK